MKHRPNWSAGKHCIGKRVICVKAHTWWNGWPALEEGMKGTIIDVTMYCFILKMDGYPIEYPYEHHKDFTEFWGWQFEFIDKETEDATVIFQLVDAEVV